MLHYNIFNKTIIFLCCIGLSLLLTQEVVGAEQYTSEHSISYYLNDTGETKVVHDVIINLTDKYAALSDLNIYEPVQDIANLETEQDLNIISKGNQVSIQFSPILVGPKTTSLSYSFTTKELFKKLGHTYKIEIPKVNEDEDIKDFNLKVYIDNIKLDENMNIEVQEDENGRYFSYDYEKLKKAGNLITIGKETMYKVKAKYIIDANKPYFVSIPNVASRQESIINYISHKPNSVKEDIDGNLLFNYKNVEIPKTIEVEYFVKIYGNNSPSNITSKDIYTAPQKNWNYEEGLPNYFLVNYPNYDKEKAVKVKDAFTYTTEFLEYNENKINYDFVNRIGAERLNEQNKENAVCLEYTDLLISLLRGLNIPAREVNGITVDEESKTFSQLHSWVEYLNVDNEWVQIDPTWQDTSKQDYLNKFDLYHINLLKRGVDSESPVLIKSYSDKENIVATFTEKQEQVESDLYNKKLFFINFIHNESPNTIRLNNIYILPYETKVKLAFLNNLESTAGSEYIKINILEEGILYFLPKIDIWLIIFLFLSPVIFIIVHVYLQKVRVKKGFVKDEVRRIV